MVFSRSRQNQHQWITAEIAVRKPAPVPQCSAPVSGLANDNSCGKPQIRQSFVIRWILWTPGRRTQFLPADNERGNNNYLAVRSGFRFHTEIFFQNLQLSVCGRFSIIIQMNPNFILLNHVIVVWSLTVPVNNCVLDILKNA